MRATELPAIDLGQIQTFLMVAGTRSFTKAAELLYISQPVVSKRVAALETALGMQLFIRWKREVKLTPAGRVLYSAWSGLMQELLEAINKASSFQAGYSKHLTIGYCASSYPYQIGAHFNRMHPDIDLYFIKMQYPTMLERLLAGAVDVVFFGAFAQRDFMQPPFKCKVLKRFPMTACVRSSCPLAQKKEIEIVDLRNFDFVMLSPLISPMWLGFVTDLCIQERFTPRVSVYVDDVFSLPMNLRSDNSVFLTDKYCAIEAEHFDLVYLPVKGVQSGSMIAWNEENESGIIAELIRAGEQFWAGMEP